MVSNRFLLIALAFATVLLITSQIVAAKELASNHEREVEDAKYDHDDRGHNGGHRRHNNSGNHHWRGCKYGCCGGGGYYNGHGGGGGGCTTCCSTRADATAYKQAHDQAQTHN